MTSIYDGHKIKPWDRKYYQGSFLEDYHLPSSPVMG